MMDKKSVKVENNNSKLDKLQTNFVDNSKNYNTQDSVSEQPDLKVDLTNYNKVNFYMNGNKLVRYIGNESKVVVPEGVVVIGAGAFSSCESVKDIILPKSLKLIEEAAFKECINLKSLSIPSGVTRIGDSAFLDCRNLQRVDIPDTVDYIGVFAFACCTSLRSIVIPEGVGYIHIFTFMNCCSLYSITIPSSVTYIDYRAFYGCSFLEEVHIKSMKAWRRIFFRDKYSKPTYYAKTLYINGKAYKKTLFGWREKK